MTHRVTAAVAISCARTGESPQSLRATALVSYRVQDLGQGLCIFFTFVSTTTLFSITFFMVPIFF